MPSAPNSRALLRVARDVGVRAHLEPAKARRTSSMKVPNSPLTSGVDRRRLAQHDAAGRAVERDPVAFLDGDAIGGERARACRPRGSPPAPHTHGLPMPRATTAAWTGQPARRGEDALRGVHAVDVVGRGLLADQDHLLLRRRALRPCRRRTPRVRPRRPARRRGPVASTLELGLGIEARDAAAGRAMPARPAAPPPRA